MGRRSAGQLGTGSLGGSLYGSIMNTTLSKRVGVLTLAAFALYGCSNAAQVHTSQAAAGQAPTNQKLENFNLKNVDLQIQAVQADTKVPAAVKEELLSKLQQQRAALASSQ